MLLAVDTSTAQVGIALYDGAQVSGEYAWRGSRRHTVELGPAIQDLLGRCGCAMDDVRALGVALGPGSFTSLRVGLALVKGLAVARHIPLIGIPTLDVHAAGQPASRLPLLAVIRAGRGRFAAGWYRSSENGWQPDGEQRVFKMDDLLEQLDEPAVVCGEFTADERRVLSGRTGVHLASPAGSVRRPAVLAELAWARWQAGHTDDEASLAPIYLHAEESAGG